MEGFQSTAKPEPISHEAFRLKKLLIQDDERRRQQFILNISDRGNSKTPNEVSSGLQPLISNPTSLENQLMDQVNYYQDALVTLKSRADEIATENAMLYERMRESIINEPLSSLSDDDDDEESDGEINSPAKLFSRLPKKERLMKTKGELDARKTKTNKSDEQYHELNEEVDKLQEIQKAKTKHLESLLKSARKQIEDQDKVISNLRTEVNYFKTPVKEDEMNVQHPDHCLTSKSLPDSIPGTKLVERLTRECKELSCALEKQQKLIAESNRREEQAYEQVKKSCELVEQLQLEKQEVMVQNRQLTKDASEYKEKYFSIQKRYEEHKRTFDTKSKNNMESTIKTLNEKVEEQVLKIAGLENELEKCLRTKNDFKTELEQFQLKMLKEETETKALIDETRKDTLEAIRGKTLAEQELHQASLEFRSKEKKKTQEIEQLTIEVKESKRRLQMADDAINNLQNEVIRLTNQINTSDQQIHREQLQRKLERQSYEDQKKQLIADSSKREHELAQLLQQNDQRFSSTRSELTRMLESQANVLKKYKDECNALSANLVNEKKKNDDVISKLWKQIAEYKQHLEEIAPQVSHKDEVIIMQKEQIRLLEEETTDYKEQVIGLMNKQNIILRDRNLLSKEIELLKSQLKSNATLREMTLEL